MKKFFYSLAIALVALMVSLPTQAVRVSVTTYQELFSAMTMGKINDYYLVDDDTISVDREINWSHFEGTYLVVPSNRTRNLDLNGFTLRYSTSNAQYSCAITMRDNSVLNIYDSKGGGQFICLASTNLATLNSDYNQYIANNSCLYGVSNGVVNMSEGNNSVLNIYGGTFQATIGDNSSNNKYTSVTYHCPNILLESWIESQTKFKTNTVNIYGGQLSSIRNEYGFPYYDFDQNTLIRKPIFSNEKVTINLYGGELGDANATFPGLTYYKGFKGELKEGTIYGISSTDHLNNFANVTSTDVYINGTKSTVNALKTQDLNDKTVRFAYEPEITVSGVEVTKDNCDDILGDGKVGFDIASNTLYLKTKEAGKPNTINGNIVYDDFKLNIVVDGIWSLNGRIVGHDGDLIISPAHFALTEEDGDILAIHSQNSTAVSLNGKSFCAKNRVRVFIEDNNTHTQTAVSCGMFVINNAWFDAWGKKPIVDCQNSMITNAKITSGSLKDNDVIQVVPNITKYVVWVDVNDKSAGTVTGDGLVNEGVSHTVTATPKSGYHFLRWSNGVTENPYTFIVTQDTVLYALFEADVVINYYDINVVSSNETMGTVSGGGTHLEQGQTVTITATPNEGYQFLYWTTADGQVQGAISQWTVTKDETLIAHFRVAPPADAYNLWVCGTQVTGSNSADILGDGVWCYDHETRTLTVMKDATYNLTNSEFISDFVSGVGTLTINVGNHKLEATCTTTDEVIRTAIWGPNIIFTGTTYHGMTVTAQNMYPANVKTLTVTGHMDLTINLKNTTEFGKKWFATAVLLGSVTPSIIVDGANLYINSGVGESAGSGYKATNKTDQAANLSMNNASIQWGSISSQDLGILDDSPKYEINYLTPALESLCLTSAFGLSFFEGTHFNLYAYPATGYKFVSWSDGNTDNPRLIIMPAHNVYLDPIVEVDESQNPKGAIINASATEGQGSITGFTSGWYAEGTELTITAVPAEGYKFVQWSDGEVSNPYFITVEDKKNINITAMFEPTTTTAVSNVESQQTSIESRKMLHNGILFIERNGKIYDARGIEVN